MRGKPHIYRHAGAWYCRRDIDGIRLLGIASDTPAIAFAAAANWHRSRQRTPSFASATEQDESHSIGGWRN